VLEMILLSIVFLAAMGLISWVYIRMNSQQQEFIKNLVNTNQSLLNQVRSKDISSLAGLQSTTGILDINEDEQYQSTEDREMAAYWASAGQNHTLGEGITDEDLETFRTGL
jgi:predicted PurR-regulated permease PerM